MVQGWSILLNDLISVLSAGERMKVLFLALVLCLIGKYIRMFRFKQLTYFFHFLQMYDPCQLKYTLWIWLYSGEGHDDSIGLFCCSYWPSANMTRTLHAYLSQNVVCVPQLERYMCTSTRTLHVYLNQNVTCVPQLERYMCTSTRTLHAYLNQNVTCVP